MNVLVTGAAGYIGSIVAERLIKEGYFVVALDNLKQGYRDAIDPEAIFVQADLSSLEKLGKVFHCCKIEAVMHLAAESLVEYSITDPKRYFQANVIHGINLLDTMLKYDVCKLVFSSTAAVYGEPNNLPIKESAQPIPVNSYGESKLMFEKILYWYERAYKLKSISLRYFNAAGASEFFGEDHDPETHLIPNIFKVALGQRECIPIFGTDYETRDGSCIRDYIHVLDIAKAHILALKHLGENQGNKMYNLGNGEGYSVLEVVKTASQITGVDIPMVVHPRRSGDPAVLIASSELAKLDLGWQPEYSELGNIIGSAWQWQKKHPKGYESKLAPARKLPHEVRKVDHK